MNKIYLWCVHQGKQVFMGYALAEDGTGLASHWSSDEQWSKHDMGLCSDWKHDIYKQHYPDGYEVAWLGEPEKDEGWKKAFAINKEIAEGEE